MRFIQLPPPTFVGDTTTLKKVLSKCMTTNRIAVDTETMGKEPQVHKLEDQVLYMGISPDEGSRYFVPRKYLHYFKPILSNVRIEKVFHNYKFDAHRLLSSGLEVKGKVIDTAILHSLHNTESRHGLDFLSDRFFGIPMAKYKDIMGSSKAQNVKPGHEIWEKFLDYGTLDALVTLKLANILEKKLNSVTIFNDRTLYDFYWKYEYPQLMALFDMERIGVRINEEALHKLEEQYTKEKEDLLIQINREAGKPINPSSVKQLRALLYDDLKLPVLERSEKTGDPSTGEAVLEKLFMKTQLPLLKKILEYRSAEKGRSTCAKTFTQNSWKGRVHTNFNPVGTKTGRLSSNQPNLQNVDPKFRSAFIADEGKIFIGRDYSQLELRIITHLALEPDMIKVFLEDKDMHLFNVAKMNDLSYEEVKNRYDNKDKWVKEARAGVKAIVYGLSYGAGSHTTSVQMSKAFGRKVSLEEAQAYLDKYFQTFPKVERMMRSLKNVARQKGFSTTLCGKRRHLPDITSRNRKLKSQAMRQALNAPIQGTAADITKAALIRCHEDGNLKDLGVELLLQVHDELIFSVPKEVQTEAMERIKLLMEDPFDGYKFKVPLETSGDLGSNWGDIK